MNYTNPVYPTIEWFGKGSQSNINNQSPINNETRKHDKSILVGNINVRLLIVQSRSDSCAGNEDSI